MIASWLGLISSLSSFPSPSPSSVKLMTCLRADDASFLLRLFHHLLSPSTSLLARSHRLTFHTRSPAVSVGVWIRTRRLGHVGPGVDYQISISDGELYPWSARRKFRTWEKESVEEAVSQRWRTKEIETECTANKGRENKRANVSAK